MSTLLQSVCVPVKKEQSMAARTKTDPPQPEIRAGWWDVVFGHI